jgi:hypothetical protein
MQYNDFLFIWLVPFITPLAGFFLAKISILKKTRILIDVILFFGAFLLDLAKFSLKPEILSISFGILLMAIVFKISWSALKMKVKVFRYVVFIAGFVIFFAEYGEWMINSPERVKSWHFPQSVETYTRPNRVFEVRDYRIVRGGKTHRDFQLVGSTNNSLFLKKMDSFTVPDYYVDMPFKFRWDLEQTGMHVWLIGNTDTLWTLKEEHND